MLGQPAGLKVDFENSEPQESRWVVGLHGKPRGPGTAPNAALPDGQGINGHKPLFLFCFWWDLVSSQKPLPIHCVNSPSRHEWLSVRLFASDGRDQPATSTGKPRH